MKTLEEKVREFDDDAPDWQIADALNTPDVANGSRRVKVLASAALAVLMQHGDWPALKLAKDDTAIPVAARRAAILLHDAVTLSDGLDTTSDEGAHTYTACLNALSDANILAAGSLLALDDE